MLSVVLFFSLYTCKPCFSKIYKRVHTCAHMFLLLYGLGLNLYAKSLLYPDCITYILTLSKRICTLYHNLLTLNAVSFKIYRSIFYSFQETDPITLTMCCLFSEPRSDEMCQTDIWTLQLIQYHIWIDIITKFNVDHRAI